MKRQIYQYHPIIGYTYIPNIRARVPHESGGYLVQTNNVGFRDDKDFTIKKVSHKKRILVFGDSYTAGDGVSNGSRFSDILENRLYETEVYNFGLPGTGTDQQYLVFKEFVLKSEYDLIIVSIFVENITRVMSRYKLYSSLFGEKLIMPKPYFILGEKGELLLKNVPVPNEKYKPENFNLDGGLYVHGLGKNSKLLSIIDKIGGRTLRGFIQKVSRYHHYPQYDSPDSQGWKLLKAILDEWISLISSKVILLIIPSHYHYNEVDTPQYYQQRFKEFELFSSATVVDPLCIFLDIPRKDRKRLQFEKDVHPSKLQHEILANEIFKAITKYNLI